ncbi:MAG TPA: hypothetical protein VF661_09900 [Actinomycetales bacterium]|jgi:hypothetical protein
MSTETLTARQRTLAGAGVALALAALVGLGLVLREHAPGDMGNGFLVGGGLALVAAGIGAWRVTRRPDQASTFERAWSQRGDERDDAVLTRSLAVLGLLSLPLAAAAVVAIALGALVSATLTLLLLAEVVVLAVAFVLVNRRG